jgi:hypothetical protein
MDRPSRVLLLASLLLAVAGLCWLGGRGAPPPAPVAASVQPQAGGSASAAGAPVDAPRRAALPPPPAPPARAAARAPVARVRGRVFRSNMPLPGCALSFHRAGSWSADRETDWDFTGRDGAYEVELPADRYVVRSDDDAAWTVALHVSEGCEELVVDFHLPR